MLHKSVVSDTFTPATVLGTGQTFRYRTLYLTYSFELSDSLRLDFPFFRTIEEKTGPDPTKGDHLKPVGNVSGETFWKYAGEDQVIDARDLRDLLNELALAEFGETMAFGIEGCRRLSPCSKWADLSCGEDEKMVALIVSKMRCAVNIIYYMRQDQGPPTT